VPADAILGAMQLEAYRKYLSIAIAVQRGMRRWCGPRDAVSRSVVAVATNREKEVRIMERGKNLSMLAGLGVGATLMYFLDPRGGGRRRALVRDKSVKVSRKSKETLHGRAQDIRNRMKGAAHEAGLIHAGNHSRSQTAAAR
jgi:hypothetical protein